MNERTRGLPVSQVWDASPPGLRRAIRFHKRLTHVVQRSLTARGNHDVATLGPHHERDLLADIRNSAYNQTDLACGK